MRKSLLVAGLLSLSTTAAWAQTSPALPTGPAVPPAAVLPARPAADSAQAVRTLFRKRRNLGTGFASVGSLVLLRGVLFNSGTEEVVVSAGIAVPLIALGVSKLSRFGSKKEDEYIKQYQQGKPLPRFIRRRIQPSYFRPTDK